MNDEDRVLLAEYEAMLVGIRVLANWNTPQDQEALQERAARL